MPTWITEQVAIGGAAITPDNWRDLAEKWNITAVLNLRAEHQDVFAAPQPVAYLWLPTIDHANPSPGQMLLAVTFIATAVQSQQRVLVHCKMGIGRSPTVVAAYLVWTGLSVDEAIEKVVASGSLIARPVVSRYTLDRFLSYVQETSRR